MRLVIETRFVAACLLAGLSAGFASEPGPADNDLKKQIEKVVAQIREGDFSKGVAFRSMGRQAIPILIEYADDHNPHVRDIVTLVLGESADERAIPTLVERLMLDDNPNVWRRAINGLRRHPPQTLKVHCPDRLLQALEAHLRRWGGTSPEAALLIGDLGGNPQMHALRRILKESQSIRGDMDVRTHLVPKMKDACLKALFKLGDKDATEEVRASFERDDVPGIVFAVEAVVYAGKKEYTKNLMRLLDDSRDAVRPSPGWGSYLRVQDIAINAIVQLSGIKPSFPLRKLTRYADDEVAEVKRLIAEAKTD